MLRFVRKLNGSNQDFSQQANKKVLSAPRSVRLPNGESSNVPSAYKATPPPLAISHVKDLNDIPTEKIQVI